jgi:hypothetical protein
MLDSLDTLIAFVLIMLVVSLLITIVVQMCSAFLNLRGLNLLKGLGKTFAVILPDVASLADTEDKEKNAKKLASFILKGRLISDSSFIKHWPKWWRFATAARPDEIFDSIHRIAAGQRSAPDGLKQTAQRVLTALGLNAGTLDDALETAKNLGDTVNNALATVLNADSRTVAQNALKEVGGKLIAFETDATRVATAAAGDVEAAYKKFQYWTDICQERVQQWFTLHTRLFTILFALMFAFWLQLDTVEIFKLVSSNKALREKLIAQSAAVTSQAEKVVGGAVDKTTADTLKQHYAEVKADFANSGFALFPKDGVGSRWSEGWNTAHLFGVLFSVGLLSLGAPFWYNALKNLTSLRSSVAQNISKEQEQAQQQGDGSPRPPPPTVMPAAKP